MTTNHPFYEKSVDAAGKRGIIWKQKFCCHKKPLHMEFRLIPSLRSWMATYMRVPANKVTEEDNGDVVIEYKNGEETVARTQIGLGNVKNPIVDKDMLARQNHWREVIAEKTV